MISTVPAQRDSKHTEVIIITATTASVISRYPSQVFTTYQALCYGYRMLRFTEFAQSGRWVPLLATSSHSW